MDEKTTISTLKEMHEQFLQERNWGQFQKPKDLAIAIAIEAAELMEIFQWKEQKSANEVKLDEETMQRVKEELADVIIYSLGMANRLDIDVSNAVKEKIEKNHLKYPKEKFTRQG